MEIILGKTAGFCYGVKRAVEGAKSSNLDNLYCLGEIVHNQTVVDDLTSRGIIFIEDINEAPSNSSVIVRAHGVSKDVYEMAKEKDINLIDYTCPNVLKIHDIIRDNSDKFIILCGDKEHPENIGSISYANHFYIINEVEEINDAVSSYENSNLKDLVLISQTTYSVTKFAEIKSILESKYPNIIIYNTICGTTEIRQKETEKLASNVDIMIIIGGKNSSNTKKLYDVSIKKCNKVLLISTKDELDNIPSSAKVGIMAGASTPIEVINDVVNALKEMESHEK